MSLPTDIINLIVEYSINKCDGCNRKVKIVYTHHNTHYNRYRAQERDRLWICKKCVKEFMWYAMKMEYEMTKEEIKEVEKEK